MAVNKPLKGGALVGAIKRQNLHPWTIAYIVRGKGSRENNSAAYDTATRRAEQHELDQAAAGQVVNLRLRQDNTFAPKGGHSYVVEQQPVECKGGCKGHETPANRTIRFRKVRYSRTPEEMTTLKNIASGKAKAPAKQSRSERMLAENAAKRAVTSARIAAEREAAFKSGSKKP